ncbi:MAG TPA: DHA2 family efflux MFS transporter permease subunit [Candidatus Dormibacteraeota bacterium]|nr:DHA2 family efflux MFS transporter permease subunit [Candidatus Dormibacteraeota bacterium]
MGAADSSSGLPPERDVGGWRRLLVEPRRPAPIANSPNAHWWVVATVCVGAFMGQLDASIVVIALPSMQTYFHSSLGAVEWVTLAYLLSLVALVTAVGRFADMVGRKLLYIYGFAIFIIGSGLCGLAPSLVTLDIFRVVQGLGAAMLQANSVALIVQAMPREKLGRGIGVQGAAQALGLALGPGIGGLLLVLGGWRLLFLVNVPAGMIGFGLGWFLLPRSRFLARREPIDWVGLGLFVIAVASLLLALSFGDQAGWSSVFILICFGAMLVFGVGFLAWEARASAPMMRLAVFRMPAFSFGVTSGLLSYLALFGTLFILPFYLQFAGHMSPGAAGLRLLILPLALGITAPLAGIVADRLGARPLTVGGMVLTAAALLTIALHPSTGWLLLMELVAIGIGLGTFTPPNNAAIMGAVARDEAGMASGILNMTRGVGTAMGVALVGLVFGLAAGISTVHAHSPVLVERGLVAAALFLTAIAVAAAALSSLRGGGQLSKAVDSL